MASRDLFLIALVIPLLCILDAPAQEPGVAEEPASVTGETPAVSSWDALGNDVEIEVRVILAGTSGIGGSFPRELFDMRSVLAQRFKQYRSFRTVNTIWVSSWAGETATTLVFPRHVLSVDVVAVDPRGPRAKVTVSLDLDRAGALTETDDFVRADDVAIGQEREWKGKEDIEPLSLLRSSMTVDSKKWRVVGGTQVRLTGDLKEITSDPQRGSTSLSAGGVRSSRDDGALIRYIIIGLRTLDKT